MSMEKRLFGMRTEYGSGELSEGELGAAPFQVFNKWLEDAVRAGFKDPNAMSLSTVGDDGRPSSRMVLLKSFGDEGFVFFTNYESRKAIQIEKNPSASLLFFWDILERQVRIEGILERTTPEESEEYFRSRPLDSRIGAVASKQSRPLESRGQLVAEVAKVVAKHPLGPPRPDYWGGYRLKPDYFEFWQGRKSRLHDRITFRKEGLDWKQERLYP